MYIHGTLVQKRGTWQMHLILIQVKATGFHYGPKRTDAGFFFFFLPSVTASCFEIKSSKHQVRCKVKMHCTKILFLIGFFFFFFFFLIFNSLSDS